MKKVLVLGAGMVSKPLVDYLLDHQYQVTLGDLNLSQAQALIADHPRGQAIQVNMAEPTTWQGLVGKADMVISLLPPPFHPKVAEVCLTAKKHFASASYLSEAMSGFDSEARRSGLVFLNEMGLDPGLDHATAMELIDEAHDQGFTIESFESHCGGIPSRKAANNPLRYKLSWSPRGFLGALTRASRFRRMGQLMEIPGDRNLGQAQPIKIPGAGVFETTPNADALFYGERYGLHDATTVYRGTLRYPGWASFWRYMLSLGFVNQEPSKTFHGVSAGQAMMALAGLEPSTDLIEKIKREHPEQASVFIEALDSLGLLDPEITLDGDYSAFGILLERAQATMCYDADEADLVVLHHEFLVRKAGQRERWTSTLIQEGKPEQNKTAMALTVGVPLGIAARLILEGQIAKRGVMIPIDRTIYRPLLDELHSLGLGHTISRTPMP